MKQKFILGLAVVALALAPMFGFSSVVNAESGGLIDDTRPAVLVGAQAKNTGGTRAKEAGDSIVLKFSETTNKFDINSSNIDSILELSNDHSFLDGSGQLGTVEWSDNGEKLFIVLSANTSVPTVSIGDKVRIDGSSIKDLSGESVKGFALIRGSFTATHSDECRSKSIKASESGSSDEEDHEEKSKFEKDDDREDAEDEDCDRAEEERGKFRCGNGLQNGQLYLIKGSPTVYLLAACRLKPFRGQAAFNSRGLKFDWIKILEALPKDAVVSDEPVLPVEGTLVKGSDATVWFVSHNGKRRGFVNANIFARLGFSFGRVDQISDTDLGTIETDSNVEDGSNHPDGALIKCSNSDKVFKVIDNVRFPFANAESFNKRGHRFSHILAVDCGRFAYREGAPIAD